jgi:hypothetical protein
VWSLVFTAQTLCTVGYGHVHAISEPEIAFVVPFLMICSMIFSIYIANMQMNTRSRFDPDALAAQSRNQVMSPTLEGGTSHQVRILDLVHISRRAAASFKCLEYMCKQEEMC